MFSVKLKKKEKKKTIFFFFFENFQFVFHPLVCVCVCAFRFFFLRDWNWRELALRVCLFLLNRESSVCRGNSNRGYSPLTFWSWLVCAFVRRVNLERKKKKRSIFVERKAERIHNQMLAPKSCCGTWWIEPVHLYSVSGSVCNTRL